MIKFFSKEKFGFLKYLLSHPMDGFYELRRFDKGSLPLALLIVAAFSLCFSMNRLLAGFVVNDVDPLTVNSLREMGSIFLFYFLFCIGNWSVTCLMEGEGRMKDIMTATGYALLPLVLAYIPATIVSQFVAANEEAFYGMILFVGIAWSLILVLLGIMTVHNYTLGKTLVTLILTFVAMLIIIFVALLLFSLVSQLYGFAYSIYTELLFRG